MISFIMYIENNFGVRQYGDNIGCFFCPDKMWEKYYSLSPYAYCGNNPVSASDPSGLAEFLQNGKIFANDGIEDGLKFTLIDDCSPNDYSNDGKFDFGAIKNSSFELPPDHIIADFMNKGYNNAVIPGPINEFAEAGGVVGYQWNNDVKTEKFFFGGVNKNRPENANASGEASQQVQTAKNEASDANFGLMYYFHTHPFNQRPTPSNTDRATASPGIVGNNNGFYFYNKDMMSFVPLQLFQDFQKSYKGK
ncbi:MAG: hypothetical protein NT007_07900 [Candidatus Kapabacteria bacterium]|nr:hypothetical protein [Candidatus Kapabacteria bacterium]